MNGSGRSGGAAVIPTGFDPGSYPCVRSLSRRGVRTIVASEHENVLAAESRFCDESVIVPPPDDDLLAYRDALVGLAARPAVETLVPVRPQDQYLFSKYRNEFERYATVVAPPFETLGAVFDRVRLAEIAERADVPVPETRPLSETDDWSGEQIVKARYNLLAAEFVPEYGPRESDVAKTVEHVSPGDCPDRAALREELHHEPIVQEYVESDDEFVFSALYDRGEPLATFQHRQIRGDSYTGGGGVYRKTVEIPELDRVGRRLLDELDWHGPACIEYMRDAETGEFVLTEVNPRMWQSLACAVHAGADFPHYYWLQATGRADEIDPEYEVGTGSHLLYGELGHLLSIRREDSPLVARPSLAGRAAEIAASCYATPKFDTLRADDPMPFLSGVRRVLKE